MCAADAGHARAMFFLGCCYERGEELEKDAAKTAELYMRAADAGDTNAMFNLGVAMSAAMGCRRMCPKLLSFTSARPMQEISRGCVALWSVTSSVPAWPKVRFAPLTCTDAPQALIQPVSWTVLVLVSNTAPVLKRQIPKVSRCTSALPMLAMNILGALFKHGRGVDEDMAKAVELYRRAAEMQHAGAMRNLGICFAEGTGVEEDEVKAVELY
jgi:TPR repeat protein